MKGILNVLGVAATAAVLASSPAFGQDSEFPSPLDDPAHGKTIAEAWCSSCHLVGPGEDRTALAGIPTFSSIAPRLPEDVDVLAAFIIDPHPPMPELGLTRQNIRDVLAYIATLD
jgi:mono/diheme cytochrome c family protein